MKNEPISVAPSKCATPLTSGQLWPPPLTLASCTTAPDWHGPHVVRVVVLDKAFVDAVDGQESKPLHMVMTSLTDGKPSPPLYGDAGSAVPLVANNETGLLGRQLGFSTTDSTGAMPASLSESTQAAR